MFVEDIAINEGVRRVLVENGALSSDTEKLGDGDDLYGAGMTSFASVNVMLALEDEFDIEFPDRLLKRAVFSSIASIGDAIRELLASNGGAR